MRFLSRRILSLLLVLSLMLSSPGLWAGAQAHPGDAVGLSAYQKQIISLVRQTWSADFFSSIVIDTQAETIRVDGGEEKTLDTPLYLDEDGNPLVPILDVLEAQGQEASYDEQTDTISVGRGRGKKTYALGSEREKSRRRRAQERFEPGQDDAAAPQGNLGRAEAPLLDNMPPESMFAAGDDFDATAALPDTRRVGLPLISSDIAEELFLFEVFSDGAKLVITRPYQTRRIVVDTGDGTLRDTYGASQTIADGLGQYVLQYPTEAATRSAYEKLKALPFTRLVALDRIVRATAIEDAQPVDEGNQGQGANPADDLPTDELEEFPTEDAPLAPLPTNDAETPTTSFAAEDDPMPGEGGDGETLFERAGAFRVGSDEYRAYLEDVAGTGRDIVVAVLDTGADTAHPFLAGRLLPGYSTIGDEGNWFDGDGHGTHVSGIVADNTPDNVKIMPIKVLDDDGFGSDLTISIGMQIAAQRGVDVINMSFGGYHGFGDNCLEDVAMEEWIVPRNIIAVAAAGNDDANTDNFCPAHTPECITVAATDPHNDTLADFSNYGDAVDIAAPGVGILSSFTGGEYETMSGTSMAAPFVTAAAALLKLERTDVGGMNIHTALKAVSVDSFLPGRDPAYGEGVLDFRKALGLLGPAEAFWVSLSSVSLEIDAGYPGKEWVDVVVSPLLAIDKSYNVQNTHPEVAVFDGKDVVGLSEGATTLTLALCADAPDAAPYTIDVAVRRVETWVDYAAESYAGGYGTKAFPYLIETAEQLAKLSYDFYHYDELDYNERLHFPVYFVQTADIDLSEHEWLPIGKQPLGWNLVAPIQYDGNGYTIRGLTINRSRDSYVGLFGTVFESTLQNICLVDADITGGFFTGGLLGRRLRITYEEEPTLIKNCSVSGQITGLVFAGAIASNVDTLENCYSDAQVTVGDFSPAVGGLAYEANSVKNGIFAGTVTRGTGTEDINLSGGLTGRLSARPLFDGFTPGEMKNSVSLSTVAGTLLEDTSISHSYYNEDEVRPIAETLTQGLVDVRPRPTEDFYTKAFFENAENWDPANPWDFKTVWVQEEGKLPRLRADHDAPLEQKILESIHPIGPHMDESQTYTHPEKADMLRVTFSPDTYVEDGFLYIYDADGFNIYGSPFAQDALAGITLDISGSSFTVRLVTGASGGGFGYRVIDVVPQVFTGENYFSYTIENDEVTITGYSGPGGVLLLPDTLEGYPVTAIGDFAFSGYRLTYVRLPDTLQRIGRYAFAWNNSLSYVSFGPSLKTIDEYAFASCGLQEVFLPEGLTTLGEGAFAYSDSLTDVTFGPDLKAIAPSTFFLCNSLSGVHDWFNLQSIGDFAFAYSALSSVSLPPNLTSVGRRAFMQCPFTTVILPKGLSDIGPGAFASSSLTDIIVDSDNAFFADIDGVLMDKQRETLWQYPAAREGVFDIPAGVKAIGEDAFYRGLLSGVTLPQSVQAIGPYAFMDCQRLTALEIPEGVTTLETGLFTYCFNLRSVILPNSLTRIGDRAFDSCINLSEINFGPEVSQIGARAFLYCNTLSQITLPEKLLTVSELSFNGCRNLRSVTFPDGVQVVEDGAFSDNPSLSGALFYGDAPNSFGASVFDGAAPGFTLYYLEGKSGWSTPLWNGYPTKVMKGLDYVLDLSAPPLVSVGGTLWYTVTMQTVDPPGGLLNLGFWLSYDSGVMTYDGFSIGDMPEDWSVRINDTGGTVRVLAGDDALQTTLKDGDAFTLYIAFHVNTDVEEGCVLGASLQRLEGTDSAYNPVEGVGNEAFTTTFAKLTLLPWSWLSVDENGHLLGLPAEMTPEWLLNEFISSGNLRVVNADGTPFTGIFVGTSCRVQLVDFEGRVLDEVTVVIRGDVTGSGTITPTDYARVAGAYMGTYTLTGVYLLAADVTGSGSITPTDYSRIAGHYLGTYNLYP